MKSTKKIKTSCHFVIKGKRGDPLAINTEDYEADDKV